MLKLRPNTTDLMAFTEVFLENEYRLPDRMDGMRVIDAGAHIGCFTLACLCRGARVICAYESDPESFRRLDDHFCWAPEVHAYHGAMWRSDKPEHYVKVGKHPNDNNPAANGAFVPDPTIRVRAYALDEVIDYRGPFHFAKFDIECSEYPVLLTSKRLAEIPAICGEWHSGNGDPAVYGLGDWSPQHLRRALRDLGFTCEFMSLTDFPFQGLFWAWQGVYPFKTRQPLPRHAWEYSTTGATR